MNEIKRSSLNDEQMLFTILAAIVKRSDSREVVITEDEMDSVNSDDMVLMYYDKSEKKIILSMSIAKGSDQIH
tara:strand:- start:117 stop:335 length:219 start_codon:yes stop_codon:yes gene_type:complete